MSIIGTLPYNIMAGQLVSAAPVMGNYNWIVNQTNANAAPLANPTFTGTVTVQGSLAVTTPGGLLTCAQAVIGAPASGVALTVNAVSGSDGLDVVGNFNAGLLAQISNTNAGTNALAQININGLNGATQFSIVSGNAFANCGTTTNTSVSLTTNNLARIVIAAAGNVTINAPTSGAALTVAGFSGAHVADFNSNQNGASYVTNNNTATGASTSSVFFASTGTANSSLGLQLNDNAGSPSAFITTGIGVVGGLAFFVNAATRMAITQAGNVIINAPTSGVALTVNGVAGNGVSTFNVVDGHAALNVVGPAASQIVPLQFQQSGQTQWVFYQPLSSNDLRFYAGADRVIFTGAGNVTINIPASGVALTVNGLIGSADCADFVGNANAINTVRINNQATGASAAAQLSLQTGTANSYTNFSQVDNSGSPYMALNCGSASSGFYLQMNGASKLSVSSAGNVVLNASASALATSATNGFTYLPNCAGIPTGVPATLYTGASATVVNSNLGVLFGYLTVSTGSAWCPVAGAIPQNSQSGNYTLALSDTGGYIYCTNSGAQTITIPANSVTAFPIGTVITIDNEGTTAVTVAINTDTLKLAATTSTGSRTLNLHGICTIVKETATQWKISGTGVT